MPAKGTRPYWTKSREAALHELAKVGSSLRKNESTVRRRGHIDWEYALAMRPDLKNILKEKSANQLSKAYARIKNTKGNYCYLGCGRKVTDGSRLCEVCRLKATDFYRNSDRFYVKVKDVIQDKDKIKSFLESNNKQDLINIIVENISHIPVHSKVDILADYIKEKRDRHTKYRKRTRVRKIK